MSVGWNSKTGPRRQALAPFLPSYLFVHSVPAISSRVASSQGARRRLRNIAPRLSVCFVQLYTQSKGESCIHDRNCFKKLKVLYDPGQGGYLQLARLARTASWRGFGFWCEAGQGMCFAKIILEKYHKYILWMLCFLRNVCGPCPTSSHTDLCSWHARGCRPSGP